MPSGLIALLDDVSVIAKMAAASLDDLGAAAAKAGSKAAGVVIDDAAVTPSYVTNFTPDRELPIIGAIAMGSLRNKLLVLLPVALVLSEVFPAAITPLLMAGGLYLCFEGAEKVLEKLGAKTHSATVDGPIEDMAQFERERVAGAIRTDFILSAEVMAIALAEVAASPLPQRALILALVGVAITALVYGVVACIVKLDDVGLHLASRPDGASRHTGRVLVAAVPKLLTLLASVGMLAMLWVGGQIIVHGLQVLGVPRPADTIHGIEHAVAHAAGSLGGVVGWLTQAALSAIVGVVLGAVAVLVVHALPNGRNARAGTPSTRSGP